MTRWRAVRHRLEAALAWLALRLLQPLGPVAASNLGGLVARGLGPLLPVSRVADANLRLALPELDRAARRRVIRGVWDNLGRTAAELPHVAGLQRRGTGAGWEIVGAEVVGALVARGGPAIFFSGHIGNWEVLPLVASQLGCPFASFYRAASNPIVNRIILDLRGRVVGHDTPQFAKGAAGARGALGLLRQGGRLGMLVDQKMNDGIEARLFGHPAMTAPAAAAFALRYDCPLVPGRVERIGPARFRVTCEAPLAHPRTGDRQSDIAGYTQAMNDTLERWIRARPEQWLWLHRRWPKR